MMLLTVISSNANYRFMRLDEWLRRSGTTQSAFADEIGVTQGRVSQIVNGDTPSVDLLIKIARATGGRVGLRDFDAESVTQ